MEALSEFIKTGRNDFSNRHNNLFAFSFSQIARYYGFIKIIQARYRRAATEFIENSKAMQATFQLGTHSMTEEQIQLSNKEREITAFLHLEIESYYLFTKILLDKVVRAFEFYFGPSRGLSLDSHDNLTKNLEKYIVAKGLTTLSDDMKELIQVLKQDVSDYRDCEIAHEKSPRTMKMTMFSLGANSAARMGSIKIYPTEKDKQVESKEIDQIMDMIDKYIEQIIKYIQINQSKTNLEKADSRN